MTVTKQTVINAVQDTLAELLPTEFIPNPRTRGKTSTGNLAFNAIKLTITQTEIVISVDLAISPYMPYTNEPWLSPRWNGRKNPNEGWWERFAEEFTSRLAKKLRGTIQ